MKNKIEKELGQKVEITKQYDDVVFFNCEDNMKRSARITKTGKLKKNSITIF